jgi:hypothetical protein
MKVVFRPLALAALAALVISAGCESKSGGSSALGPSPVTPAATDPAPATNPLVGTWSSDGQTSTPAGVRRIAAVPTASVLQGCTNFRWTVTAQTATTASGPFSTVCLNSFLVAGTASGEITGGSNVVINVTGSADRGVDGPCAISLTGTGVLSGDTLPLTYTGTTCLGPVTGSVTLRRKTPAATTPDPVPTVPDPTPTTPTTPDPPTPSSPSGFDMTQATMYDNDPGVPFWPVTTSITSVVFTPGAMQVDFDRRTGPNMWPESDFGVQYTLGICLNISNHWDCSGVVQFWTGRDLDASGIPSEFALTWFYNSRWGPMQGYQPKPGEIVGVFVGQGNLRGNGFSSLKERSNVVMLPFGGSYQK